MVIPTFGRICADASRGSARSIPRRVRAWWRCSTRFPGNESEQPAGFEAERHAAAAPARHASGRDVATHAEPGGWRDHELAPRRDAIADLGGRAERQAGVEP